MVAHRLPDPAGLWQGKLGVEPARGRACGPLRPSRSHRLRESGPLGASRPARCVCRARPRVFAGAAAPERMKVGPSTPPTYAAFPEEEHRARLARAREALRRHGIECCVSVAPEHLYYFAGYDSWVSVNSPQALVFSARGGEPTLIVRDVDIALALETSWVRDIRTYHLVADDVPALIASVAREKGLAGGLVAIEKQSYALPLALGEALAEALAPARLVDATNLLGTTRLIKSPA